MTDERPDSLAAQAASWVPPWERPQRPPDPAYAEAHRVEDEEQLLSEAARSDDDVEAGGAERSNDGFGVEDAADVARSDDDFDVEEAGSAEGDGSAQDDGLLGDAASTVARASAEEAGAGDDGEPAGDESEVPPELPPVPGEVTGPATVDAPQELPGEGELDPTDVGVGPELPLPGAIEEASEHEVEALPLVDAPLPIDGDDAGDVFDHAADDDVTDGGEVDLPVAEEVPGAEEDADLSPGAEEAGAASGIPAQGRRVRGGGAASGGSSTRTEEEVELKPLDDGELRAALEAILLVVDEPVAEMQLAQIVEQPTERVAAMLEDISARYTAAGHGFDLRRAAGGWRLYTRPEYAPYVERFVLDGQSVRLTQAALETVAVVAYKQPVTRSRISAIRGVNCDGVMRTLVTRGLIEECGTEGETGAFLYRTTALFLEKLGLNSVDQLPPLAPFLPDDVEEVLDASG